MVHVGNKRTKVPFFLLYCCYWRWQLFPFLYFTFQLLTPCIQFCKDFLFLSLSPSARSITQSSLFCVFVWFTARLKCLGIPLLLEAHDPETKPQPWKRSASLPLQQREGGNRDPHSHSSPLTPSHWGIHTRIVQTEPPHPLLNTDQWNDHSRMTSCCLNN